MRVYAAMLALALLSDCAPATRYIAREDCHPTITKMTPPAEAAEFFAGGSSQPEMAREYLRTRANWLGNDAMWVILPENGEIVGRLDDKIPPYRMKSGAVSYAARRLDGPGVVSRTAVGPTGYGDSGFQAGGPRFPTTGCWEVTYTVDGEDPLRFVVRVR